MRRNFILVKWLDISNKNYYFFPAILQVGSSLFYFRTKSLQLLSHRVCLVPPHSPLPRPDHSKWPVVIPMFYFKTIFTYHF